MDRKKILWLASWYPNRIDAYSGDFIQRHAQAVSLYHDVHVLFVMRDENGLVTKSVLSERFKKENLTEEYIYYKIRKGPASLHRLQSQLRYNQLFKRAIQIYIEENGKPDLVHVHVVWKAGLLSTWIKKKYGIPYVITEHWSLFLPEAAETFKNQNFYFRSSVKKIFNKAASISVVSNYLSEQLKKIMPPIKMRVTPNVVNTTIFQHKPFRKPIDYTSFLHVSGLEHPKSPEIMMRAFVYLKDKNIPFQLHIIGPQHPQLMRFISTLNLNQFVFFHGEMPQTGIAEYMQKAHALILYSRYETFGCVVIEANACGIPVIVSDIPALRETVQESVNGIFAPAENAEALSEKLFWFINNKEHFDASLIARNAHNRYSFEAVGLQFDVWYQSVLKDTST